MPSRIEDYALIGDCETAALVSRKGSIDWLCWPHFASAACFAALLGSPEEGHWSITAKGDVKISRRYLDHTLVLETKFETAEGAAILLDFMPPRGHNSDVVRIVRGVRGSVAMETELVLRFDYGRSVPWVTRRPMATPTRHRRPRYDHASHPSSSARRKPEDVRRFHRACRRVCTLRPHLRSVVSGVPRSIDAEAALTDTMKFWEKWTGQSRLHGHYAAQLERSLDHLEGAHLPPYGRHRRRADYVAAGMYQAANATGITATAGFATRPSPCWR